MKRLFLMITLMATLLSGCASRNEPENVLVELGEEGSTAFFDFEVSEVSACRTYKGRRAPAGQRLVLVELELENTTSYDLPMGRYDFRLFWGNDEETAVYPLERFCEEQFPDEYAESIITNTLGYWYLLNEGSYVTMDVRLYHTLIGTEEEIEKKDLWPLSENIYTDLFYNKSPQMSTKTQKPLRPRCACGILIQKDGGLNERGIFANSGAVRRGGDRSPGEQACGGVRIGRCRRLRGRGACASRCRRAGLDRQRHGVDLQHQSSAVGTPLHRRTTQNGSRCRAGAGHFP